MVAAAKTIIVISCFVNKNDQVEKDKYAAKKATADVKTFEKTDAIKTAYKSIAIKTADKINKVEKETKKITATKTNEV